ncbi:AbrB/MazE/SpoVT family DNA-binding domain-containing protein [Verrucomicrobia bacterium]|nr:AbrB/MazE/SpoVT family DNA-binding domain-containing protein [bacterium]MDA7628456.1 AbrB/MazE/SpoVT family DNA-binding domain-containing protein [Verrucomicrobiota bacterium]MDB4804079.1 AbrB/MazE/SpoVT family DNA-binding domain-containing protein [Verrucomicrobiota bacterium]
MKSTLTSKGQLTIPKSIRDRMGLKAGDVLEFDEQVTYLKAQRVFDEKQMRSVVGIGRKDDGISSKEHLDDMRGTVELP